ncbi:ANTAR domain-containing protein [Polymorphospora lycopeni]|uniref:ANTAR domain-containing protein n=1 Tax=Polymorphospora lycopeni TaxID=3140240 RepID=A0ABV5CUN3_9ACTN
MTEGPDPLAAVVEQLRAERDGLRTAMRGRAIIEQAKGVLMARERITAEEAFDRLRRVSQRTNVRLVEVAARTVARVAPPPTVGRLRAAAARPSVPAEDDGTTAPATPDRDDGRAGTDRLVAHSRHLLMVTRVDAAEAYDDLVEALAETGPDWPGPGSVVLALTEPDGALRVVAARGIPAELASQWARIPPQIDTPLTDAARDRSPVLLPDRDAVRRTYPRLLELNARLAACAALPLTHRGRLLGVVGLTWRVPVDLDHTRQTYLMAAADVVARGVVRLTGGAGAAPPDWIRAVLDASVVPAAALRARRAGAEPADFEFAQFNDLAARCADRHGVRLAGTTLLTALPGVGPGELFPFCRDVLTDGLPRSLAGVRPPTAQEGQPGGGYEVRAARLGDLVLMSWRPVAADPGGPATGRRTGDRGGTGRFGADGRPPGGRPAPGRPS